MIFLQSMAASVLLIKYIEKYRGGFFEMFDVWLPGNQIWNGIDTYGNCSPDVYLKFGKPFYEEIGKYYGGQWMHMHSNALHLVKEVASLMILIHLEVLINWMKYIEMQMEFHCIYYAQRKNFF